jgi:hypothetical protein
VWWSSRSTLRCEARAGARRQDGLGGAGEGEQAGAQAGHLARAEALAARLLAGAAGVGLEHLDGSREHGGELAMDVVDEAGALGFGDEVDAIEGEEEGGAGVVGAAEGDEGVAEEGDLGELEDLGGVEDEDDGVAAGELAAADEAAEAGEVVDAGGVDELDAGGEVRARGGEQEGADEVLFAAGELGEDLGLEVAALAVGGDEEAAELVAADDLDDGAGGRGDAAGEQRLAEERVDERALALLDLAEHEHAQLGAVEAAVGVGEDVLAELAAGRACRRCRRAPGRDRGGWTRGRWGTGRRSACFFRGSPGAG